MTLLAALLVAVTVSAVVAVGQLTRPPTRAGASAVPAGASPGADGRPGSTTAGSTKRPGPVILVPGYGNDTGDLARLAVRLRAAGRRVTVMSLPGDGTGDLVAQARALARVVDAVRRGGDSVDVVGYSAGGVVARIWLVDLGGARLARRVVTLGAPLHGTAVATFGAKYAPDQCHTACHQLDPASPLLARLDRAPLPAGVTWMSVWSTADQVVLPPESARLSGAVNVPEQSVCPTATTTHTQLPADPLVIGLVLRGLGTAPLTAPSPADCDALRASATR